MGASGSQPCCQGGETNLQEPTVVVASRSVLQDDAISETCSEDQQCYSRSKCSTDCCADACSTSREKGGMLIVASRGTLRESDTEVPAVHQQPKLARDRLCDGSASWHDSQLKPTSSLMPLVSGMLPVPEQAHGASIPSRGMPAAVSWTPPRISSPRLEAIPASGAICYESRLAPARHTAIASTQLPGNVPGTHRQTSVRSDGVPAPAASHRPIVSKATAIIVAPKADCAQEVPDLPEQPLAPVDRGSDASGNGFRTPFFPGSSAHSHPASNPESPEHANGRQSSPSPGYGKATPASKPLEEAESEEKQQNPERQAMVQFASPAKLSHHRGSSRSSVPPLPYTGSAEHLPEAEEIKQHAGPSEQRASPSPLRAELRSCSEAATEPLHSPDKVIGSEAPGKGSYWTPGGARGREDRPLDSPPRKLSLMTDEDSLASGGDSDYSPSVGSCRLPGSRRTYS